MKDLALLFEGAGLAGLAVAAVCDLRARIIPNAVVLWVLCAGGIARLLTDGWGSWPSFALAVAVFVPLLLLAHRDVIGGGDAKLAAAAVLLVRPGQTAGLILAIALAGGLLSAWYLAARALSRIAGASSPRAPSASPPSTPAPPPIQLPYGVAILAGCALILLLRTP